MNRGEVMLSGRGDDMVEEGMRRHMTVSGQGLYS
jgi:hypothetical protein